MTLLLLDLGPRHAVGCKERNEFLFCKCETERAEGNAQFVVIEMSVAIEVE